MTDFVRNSSIELIDPFPSFMKHLGVGGGKWGGMGSRKRGGKGKVELILDRSPSVIDLQGLYYYF